MQRCIATGKGDRDPEGDTRIRLRAIQNIISDVQDLSAGPIVDPVKELLRDFEEFRVQWVRRSANKVARYFS